MSRVVTLTMNPALDLSTTVKEVVPFAKLRCSPMRRDPGGGGINVARVVCRLGADATAIYPIGGPAGEMLKRLVDHECVESLPIAIAGETREDFSVFETETKKQFRFIAPGPKISVAECRACLDAFESVSRTASFCVVSGSLPPGVSTEFFAEAARRANGAGCRLALDTTGDGLKAAALHEGVALVKPNQNEFAELSGAKSLAPKELVKAARDIIAHGKIGAIALTLAEQGAILVTRTESFYARAPKVEVESTVGAGDSFLGAMLWSLSEQCSWKDAFRFGVAAGSAALVSPGTDLAHPETIHRLLADVTIEEIT